MKRAYRLGWMIVLGALVGCTHGVATGIPGGGSSSSGSSSGGLSDSTSANGTITGYDVTGAAFSITITNALLSYEPNGSYYQFAGGAEETSKDGKNVLTLTGASALTNCVFSIDFALTQTTGTFTLTTPPLAAGAGLGLLCGDGAGTDIDFLANVGQGDAGPLAGTAITLDITSAPSPDSFGTDLQPTGTLTATLLAASCSDLGTSCGPFPAGTATVSLTF